MIKNDKITISELSEITGITPSSIRYYLNEGLLPSPLRKGKTKAYYNTEHVKKLKTIKDLRSKKKLSIKEIKDILPNYANIKSSQQNTGRKDDIINAGIILFREKGYDQLNINDIVEKAEISKSTFYLNYDNKEALFIDCAEKVFYDIDKDFKEIGTATDVIKRIKLRAEFFINNCHHLIDMLHIARGTSGILAAEKREKINTIFSNLSIPLQNDLNEGIKSGLIAPINSKIIAYMMIGAAEYIILYLEENSNDEIEKSINQLSELFFKGIIKHKR